MSARKYIVSWVSELIHERCSMRLADLLRSIASLPRVLPQILPPFLPYATVLAAFAVFVVWNGGIVLGTCLVTNC